MYSWHTSWSVVEDIGVFPSGPLSGHVVGDYCAYFQLLLGKICRKAHPAMHQKFLYAYGPDTGRVLPSSLRLYGIVKGSVFLDRVIWSMAFS